MRLDQFAIALLGTLSGCYLSVWHVRNVIRAGRVYSIFLSSRHRAFMIPSRGDGDSGVVERSRSSFLFWVNVVIIEIFGLFVLYCSVQLAL